MKWVPARGSDQTPPSNSEIKERVELYIYSFSGPSWPVLGWPLPFTQLTFYCCIVKKLGHFQNKLMFILRFVNIIIVINIISYIIPYRITSHHITSHHITSHHIISYHIIYHIPSNITLLLLWLWIPVCGQELTKCPKIIHIDMAVKNTIIYVIYKVLLYIQTSQPTTCFGLFQLGHLQVGHKVRGTIQILSLKS
jgi:hypothetical protein